MCCLALLYLYVVVLMEPSWLLYYPKTIGLSLCQGFLDAGTQGPIPDSQGPPLYQSTNLTTGHIPYRMYHHANIPFDHILNTVYSLTSLHSSFLFNGFS